jgi:hypothetical protein
MKAGQQRMDSTISKLRVYSNIALQTTKLRFETGYWAKRHLSPQNSTTYNSIFLGFVSECLFLSHRRCPEAPNFAKFVPPGHPDAPFWHPCLIRGELYKLKRLETEKGKTENCNAMGVAQHCNLTRTDAVIYPVHFLGDLAFYCTEGRPNPRFFAENAGAELKIVPLLRDGIRNGEKLTREWQRRGETSQYGGAQRPGSVLGPLRGKTGKCLQAPASLVRSSRPGNLVRSSRPGNLVRSSAFRRSPDPDHAQQRRGDG